ncbi:MAG: glycosyltransferase family 2 protein [Coleofasciculus sp. B1-GNL1-01]|uniref:glycosyltransferase family 2 protein n=1 Tax=Coleofasciculus sp. B1-GNL1-01 TaxID=3068484 RepID=UPI0032F249E1
MKTLTIISPVYNEEEVINDFYTELRGVLAGLSPRYDSKILFVVDRSSDASFEILKSIAEQDKAVQILLMSSRFGHQMSLLAGIDHSDSDVLIMLDSDLQHPPSLIPKMLMKYEQGYDIVYTIRQDSKDISIFKRLTSKLFYKIINKLSDVPINESAADFRLISNRVAKTFKHKIRERNQFLRGLFSWVGFRSTSIYFQVRKRRAGRSKYSLNRMIQFGLEGVVSFSKKPLKAAIITGFIFALFGFIYALISVVQYFIYASLPSGWTTLVFLVSIFSGVQLIFLGIIGEYIGAIFDEVKGRPHYIIEDKVNFNHDE